MYNFIIYAKYKMFVSVGRSIPRYIVSFVFNAIRTVINSPCLFIFLISYLFPPL